MSDFKPDLTTIAGSKMLQAMCHAMGVHPSVDGLLKAFNADPAVVVAFIAEVQRQAPEIVQMLGAVSEQWPRLVAGLAEHAERTRRIEAKLDLLLKDAGLDTLPPDGAVTIAVRPEKDRNALAVAHMRDSGYLRDAE